MPSMNLVILVGQVGQDAEVKQTSGGKDFTRFSVATTKQWKDKDGEKQEKTTWHNVTRWGSATELPKKGDTVFVMGEYTSNKKGETTYYSVDASMVSIVGHPKGSAKKEESGESLPF